MSKILIGTAILGILGVAAVASASEKTAVTGEPRPPTPKGDPLPSLAASTTKALTSQDIAALRKLVNEWKNERDPETAGALSFTVEEGMKTKLETWDLDKGSPLLRAFGLRVFQLEGRKPRVLMWADAWQTVMPNLSQALRAKAAGLSTDVRAGGSGDRLPTPDLIEAILAAVQSNNPALMRATADRLEQAGFPEQAKDLRELAAQLERGQTPPQDATTPGVVVDQAESPVPVVQPPAVPLPPAPVKPSPAPVVPTPKPSERRIGVVNKGEGVYNVATRTLGTAKGNAIWKELRELNATDKGGIFPRTADKSGLVLTAGDRLLVPASWPSSKFFVPGEPFRASPGKPAPKPAPAPAPALPAPTPAPSAPSSLRRLIAVKPGQGVYNVAVAALGTAEGNARWKELREFNAIDKGGEYKRTADKSGLVLNAGNLLVLPPSWPTARGETLGADGDEILGADGDEILGGGFAQRGSLLPRTRANVGQLDAATIALKAKLGKVNRAELAAWQKREGIEPTGQYGIATALKLIRRYGMVPPLPHTWGQSENKNRVRFARSLYAMAKRDPQRADEFRHLARVAERKAA